MDVNINPQEVELREQDRWLPIANVARLMKGTLPPSAKVSKDAKECMQECVSELISFITSEASDKCLREKRKTINGEDVLYSMYDLGFENYAEILKIYLAKYREQQALRQERGDGRPSRRYPKKSELSASQQTMNTELVSNMDDGDDISSERRSSVVIGKNQEVDREEDAYDEEDASVPSDRELDLSEEDIGPNTNATHKDATETVSEYDTAGITELSGGETCQEDIKNNRPTDFGTVGDLGPQSELNKDPHPNSYGCGQFLANTESHSEKADDEDARLDPQSNGLSGSLAPGGEYDHGIASLSDTNAETPYF